MATIESITSQADGVAIRTVLRYVDGAGLLAIGCASRALHAASEDDHLWHAVCTREGVCEGEGSLKDEGCNTQLLPIDACLCHALCGDIVVTSPSIAGSVRCAVHVRCQAKAVYLRARRLVHNWHEREPVTCTNFRECIQSTHTFANVHYFSYQL